jgi:hypothetical protein
MMVSEIADLSRQKRSISSGNVEKKRRYLAKRRHLLDNGFRGNPRRIKPPSYLYEGEDAPGTWNFAPGRHEPHSHVREAKARKYCYSILAVDQGDVITPQAIDPNPWLSNYTIPVSDFSPI